MARSIKKRATGKATPISAERRLQQTIEHMLEGYQIVGFDFRYLYVNDAVIKHGKTSREALLGRTMAEAYPGIENTEVYRLIEKCLNDRSVHRLLNHFVYPDQSEGWFELAIEPVPEGALILSIDVSEREREKRQNELLRQQLEQAQRLEGIGRLAAGVAHDFNNVLTAVAMSLDVVADALPASQAVARDLAHVRNDVERASRLTRKLLAFGRQQLLRPERINANQVLQSLREMLASLMPGHIRLKFNLSDDLAEVNFDPTQLEQVLLNLALNARDAMSEGGELIIASKNVTLDDAYLAQHAGAQLGQHVVLSVSDNGQGIPPEALPRIFEPFFTTKPEGAGTGLGLATVYGIVRQSGGHIWVYSEVGKGSKFKVYLPAAEQTLAQMSPPAKQIAAQPIASAHILLVDDEKSIRFLAERILRDAGYSVTTAAGFKDARSAFERGDAFDLLVSDVAMPDGSGIDLALLARQRLPQARLVLMSGRAPQADREFAALQPAPVVLEKPFSAVDLRQAIGQALAFKN